jgi:hypothetical protein
MGGHTQSKFPFHISLEGLKPVLPSHDIRFPSSFSAFQHQIPDSLAQLLFMRYEWRFNDFSGKAWTAPAVNVYFGAYPYKSNYDAASVLDRFEVVYDTYRWKFMYEHGYFGPAQWPMGGRIIRKSNYRDPLFPWQNAPLKRYETDKALYLITNFVYPSRD